MDKEVVTYVKIFTYVTKKEGNCAFSTKSIDLESIILSERSQPKKAKYHTMVTRKMRRWG